MMFTTVTIHGVKLTHIGQLGFENDPESLCPDLLQIPLGVRLYYSIDNPDEQKVNLQVVCDMLDAERDDWYRIDPTDFVRVGPRCEFKPI